MRILTSFVTSLETELYLVLCCYTNDAESRWPLCNVESCHWIWAETNVSTAVPELICRRTCNCHVVRLYCSCSTRYNKFVTYLCVLNNIRVIGGCFALVMIPYTEENIRLLKILHDATSNHK